MESGATRIGVIGCGRVGWCHGSRRREAWGGEDGIDARVGGRGTGAWVSGSCGDGCWGWWRDRACGGWCEASGAGGRGSGACVGGERASGDCGAGTARGVACWGADDSCGGFVDPERGERVVTEWWGDGAKAGVRGDGEADPGGVSGDRVGRVENSGVLCGSGRTDGVVRPISVV